jgi:arginine/lysine/histidine transporter system substrate-binding protein
MKNRSLFIILGLIIATSVAIWYKAEKTVAPAVPELETVVVGINTEFPPFSFKHDDQFTGFDIDIIKEVFARLKKEIIFKDMPFDALIPEIQLGNIQVIAAGITPTKERAQRALFTQPHLTGDPLVIISLKNNSPLTTLDELQGKTVVVNEGYTADSYMSNEPHINLLRLSSALASDGMLALESGRADAFVTALNPMKPYFNKYGIDTFNVTPIPGTEDSSAFAVSKHYPDLRDDIQVTLNSMQADGTLAALKTKWNM